MRVLHLIDHMGLGGAQQVVIDFLAVHDRSVAEAAVLSLRDHCLPQTAIRMAEAGVPFRGLGLSRHRPLSWRKLRGALAGVNADVLHMHLEASGTLGTLATLTLGPSRPLLVHHVHNDPTRKFSWPHRIAGRVFAARTAAHVVATASVGAATRRAFGGGIRRMEVIPYGIDRRWLDRGPGARNEALRRGARFVIGGVGRLVPQKAFHLLLRAAPRVLAEVPSTRIWIIGSGPLEAELRAEAHRAGVAESVEFLGYRTDLEQLYASMDLFVLPSRFEATSLALLEAMASGVPIVSTNVVGVSDVIENGRDGILVPPGDATALAGAILRLLQDESLRRALRDEARATVARNHTREQMVARMERLYAELVAGRDGTPRS